MFSLFISDRQKYVRAMMKAIKAGCTDSIAFLNEAGTRTDALRAIRRFEKVNGFSFNPHEDQHVDKIRGCSRHESLFRSLKLRRDSKPTDEK